MSYNQDKNTPATGTIIDKMLNESAFNCFSARFIEILKDELTDSTDIMKYYEEKQEAMRRNIFICNNELCGKVYEVMTTIEAIFKKYATILKFKYQIGDVFSVCNNITKEIVYYYVLDRKLDTEILEPVYELITFKNLNSFNGEIEQIKKNKLGQSRFSAFKVDKMETTKINY